MPEKAAKEGSRSLSLAAATLAASYHDPAPATDPGAWQKTASGRFSWSEPTTTYDVSNLSPKTRWRALYYYRARWYSPGMTEFLERDPVGYVDGQNATAILRSCPANAIDPEGMRSSSIYFRYSEEIEESHSFLTKHGLQSTRLDWFGYQDGTKRIPARNFVAFGTRSPAAGMLGNYENPQQSETTEHFIIGGDWKQGGGIATQAFSTLSFVYIGLPPKEHKSQANVLFQRTRVLQAEYIIKAFFALAYENPHTPALSDYSEFERHYRRFQYEASLKLLQVWQLLLKENTTFDRTRFLSLLATAIINHADSRSEAIKNVESFLTKTLPENLRNDWERYVYQRGETMKVPWQGESGKYYKVDQPLPSYYAYNVGLRLRHDSEWFKFPR